MLINSNPHWRDFLLYLEDTKLNFSTEKGICIFSNTFPKVFANRFLNIYPVSCISLPGSFYTLLVYKLIFASLPSVPALSICVYMFTVMAPEEVLWSISSIIHVLNSLNTWMALSAIIVLISILRSI